MLKQKLKRMRPAIGTFVEIELQGSDSQSLRDSIAMGFEKIALVEKKMSRFIESSDVGRFNKIKVGEKILVSPDLISVLKLSEELWGLSCGIFDVALGAGKIFSIQGNTLKRLGPGEIDLGGIAKGYAVDQAVKAMEPFDVSGVVNAGGDLRVFGTETKEIFIQEAGELEPQFYPLKVNNMAVATSTYKQKTVSVFAKTCMVADALTKIVLHSSRQISDLCLSKYNARGFIP